MLEDRINEPENGFQKKSLRLVLMNLQNVYTRLGVYSVQPMGLERWGAETFQRIVGSLTDAEMFAEQADCEVKIISKKTCKPGECGTTNED
jgi:hypothetical protein